MDLHADANGTLWLVANYHPERVFAYNRDFQRVDLPDNEFGNLVNPWSITSKDNRIIVGDAGRLVMFQDGRQVETVNIEEILPRKIGYIDDTLYVFNRPSILGNESLTAINPNGSEMFKLAMPFMQDMAVYDGRVYCLRYDIPSRTEDEGAFHHKVVVVGRTGNTEQEINLPTLYWKNMAIEPETGNIWVAAEPFDGPTQNGNSSELHLYSSNGIPLQVIKWDSKNDKIPAGPMCFDDSGLIIKGKLHGNEDQPILVKYSTLVGYSG